MPVTWLSVGLKWKTGEMRKIRTCDPHVMVWIWGKREEPKILQVSAARLRLCSSTLPHLFYLLRSGFSSCLVTGTTSHLHVSQILQTQQGQNWAQHLESPICTSCWIYLGEWPTSRPLTKIRNTHSLPEPPTFIFNRLLGSLYMS